MNKIPSLFVRKPWSKEFNTEQVTPECKWVFDGNATITVTVKRDGTPMARINGQWLQRRVLKVGKGYDPAVALLSKPEGFVPCQMVPSYDQDAQQYEWPGWVPLTEQYYAYMKEAKYDEIECDGTFELCGPAINGNPEGLIGHCLFKHGSEIVRTSAAGVLTKDVLIELVKVMHAEGIVISSDIGMAKLCRRDLGFEWPIRK